MSALEAVSGFTPSFNLIQPNSFNMTSARAKLDGSFGAETLLPSLTSSSDFSLPGYRPKGAVGTWKASVMSNLCSFLKSSR